VTEPTLLHLYEETPRFIPSHPLTEAFRLESRPYESSWLYREEWVGVIWECDSLTQERLEAFRELHASGRKIVLALITPLETLPSFHPLTLLFQCVWFTDETIDREAQTRELTQLFSSHLDTLRYIDALKLRSHRSGSVDKLNVVAHQWRQPINLISMEAINLSIQSTLQESISAAEVQHASALISEQAQRMAEILKSVLNMGKTHRGKEPFSINDLTERVRLFFADQFTHERIEYDSPRLENDTFLYGYATDFEEVLVNLIANAKDAFKTIAIDYPKRIGIEVECGEKTITFRIRDNAGGIPEPIREKIFEPHFSTKGHGEGFGIGLHIARLIITQEFHGTLTLGVEGNETIFTITLPRKDTQGLTYVYS
jgi:signal transduction histidine kinase